MVRIGIGTVLALVICACAISMGGANDDSPQAPPSASQPTEAPARVATPGLQQQVRMVIPLISVSAGQLAKTIDTVLAQERQRNRARVAVVSDAASNSLIINGAEDAVNYLQGLVAKLDRAPAMIRVEVVVGETPAGKGNGSRPEELRRSMDVLFQAEITTLESQQALLQFGRREPHIQGVSTNQFGQTNNVTYENTGNLVKLTPRRGVDGSVTLKLDINDSRMAPSEENVVIGTLGKGEPIYASGVDSTILQSTIRAADGQTVVVAAMSRKAKSKTQRWILLTPHIVPIGKMKLATNAAASATLP
jgi:type II secretory pathway component GspD/PulD (secretin)